MMLRREWMPRIILVSAVSACARHACLGQARTRRSRAHQGRWRGRLPITEQGGCHIRQASKMMAHVLGRASNLPPARD
ncbi:hypothetical protein DICSQDRAFT_152131, partial [Dichomitus squalens LYAD-421 SS1]